MLFPTLTFVVFLVVVFASYWIAKSYKTQNAILVVASYIFYAWWDYRFCALMFASSYVDFVLGRQLGRLGPEGKNRRVFLVLSLIANLGVLGTFKYFDFFSTSLAGVLTAVGLPTEPLILGLILPVGISFYTFQTMSYSLDIYFGRLKHSESLLDYLTFVSFFPQLVAGPIERAGNLLPQFQQRRTFDPDQSQEGVRYMLWGVFKKLVVADYLALSVDHAYGDWQSAPGPSLAIATMFFAIQIYCDFSGYSDIAIGVARLFGIRLMRNFAYPYFSQSVGEFWRRWHISLSSWFRDYIYIPLGGSRSTKARAARNILITFVVSGFWHGASWNFVAWGAINGLAMLPLSLRKSRRPPAPQDAPGGDSLVPSFGAAWRILATFAIVCVTWVFFRASTFGSALGILSSVARGIVSPAAWKLALQFDPRVITAAALCGAFLGIEWLGRRHPHPLKLAWLPSWVRWVAYTVLFQIVLFRNTSDAAPFIYFQF